ncbi:MAG: adenylyltransferase/cytidyltransferase family protein, partial [Bacteroidia bacterium]
NFNHIKEAAKILKDFKLVLLFERKLAMLAIKKIWNEVRYYHSWENHIYPMLQHIKQQEYEPEVEKLYFWAAIFHDVIYDVRNKPGENESLSALFWIQEANKAKPHEDDLSITVSDLEVEEYLKLSIDNDTIEKVAEIIKATYGHESIVPLIREFLKADLYGFTDPYKSIYNETLIRKEYNHIDWAVYLAGRKKFLKAYSENSVIKEMNVSENLLSEIKHTDNLKQNIAIYPGTFNPFHLGHFNILEKAEMIFDKVIIVYAENPEKPWNVAPSISETLFKSNRQIEFVQGSLVKWIESLPYPVSIVRGLRNTSDVQYEQNYLRWLSELSKEKLSVVNIFCDKEFEHISSSALRSLEKVDFEASKKFKI